MDKEKTVKFSRVYCYGSVYGHSSVIKALEGCGGDNSEHCYRGDIPDYIYYIDTRGVIRFCSHSDDQLMDIIKDVYTEIKPLPLDRCSKGETYWYIYMSAFGDPVAMPCTEKGTVADNERYNRGNYYCYKNDCMLDIRKINEMFLKRKNNDDKE